MDFSYDDEQQALRDAVRGLVGKTYADHEHRRTMTAKEAPASTSSCGRGWPRWGCSGCPSPRPTVASAPARSRSASSARSWARVAAPEPYLGAVVVAGGLVAACGTAEQRQQVVAPLAGGERLPAFAHAEPGGRWTAEATASRPRGTARRWTLTGTKEPVPHGGTRRRPGRQRGTARRRHRGCSSSTRPRRRSPATPSTTAPAPPASTSTARPATPLGEPGRDLTAQHRDGARPRPRDGGQPGARRDAVGAAGDDRLPQEPQAVRRHPQHLPGPDVPGRRHVRLPRADPERRRLGDHGRRDRRRRRARRRGLPGRAADQPRRPATSARRRSSSTAASR